MKRIPTAQDEMGTVAFIEIGKIRYFGVNSGALLKDSDKNIGREFFKIMKSDGLLGGAKHYGDGAVQVLTHAETHALMRAWKQTGGKMGDVVTIYVDRYTCNNCQDYLVDVMKTMKIKTLNIYAKNGDNITLSL